MENGPTRRFVVTASKPKGKLLSGVKAALERLGPLGWEALLEHHGLDLSADDLAHELSRPLTRIDRSFPGFEDFAQEGNRGVEPGAPARSLLFHAFASPRITSFRHRGRLTKLKGFPTLTEIEAIENYVFGHQPPSIDDLRARAQGARLAIVVFATEYRAALGTVHGRHADMVFARTGIARIGTEPPLYDGAARGFLPFVKDKDTGIRALPCRYAAYVACLVPGKKGAHGPLRFIDGDVQESGTSGRSALRAGLQDAPEALRVDEPGDHNRRFWVPLHKLFSGGECLLDRDIEVRLSASHVNEKIRRAHLKFLCNGHFGGWSEPALSDAPFIFHDGIADFSAEPDDGGWLLRPFSHPRLTEPASYKGEPLTFCVPKTPDSGGSWRAYQSSLNLLPQPSGARSAPEYLHARHAIADDGSERDLNDEPDIIKLVEGGGYRARHYVDFTGDGWIDVECPEIALDLPRRIPAYSIVASPDFFPLVDQTSLMQWADQSVLPSLMHSLWDAPGSGLPQALSDQRYAANLQISGANFDPDDDTMTAIVGPFGSGDGALCQLKSVNNHRASMLPDGAAGVFAPGWDVSYDRTSETDPEDTGKKLAPGVTFLTNYGLGSPFMEDSKLCAALSSFWPAAAPDITRTFAPSKNYATATPLTDEVIGLGSKPPWDGVRGPTLRQKEGKVEYASLAYADYVEKALSGGFDISEIGKTTVEEYVARTLTMGLVYRALGVETHDDKLKWSVLSFRMADPSDADLLAAQKATGRRLNKHFTYRYLVFDHADRGAADPTDFKKVLVNFGSLKLLFADPTLVLTKDSAGDWSANEVRR
ncbi:hypothetical protein [Bradyrhizobium sp. SEMIA]|uniref:hypothetical protein n=1 Tax=Bradyrhizobium sp. SEMIA TaxID=2597515 RepID=UPI0018A4A162|nr:hypothetical protein [Bradyrhizobium sp. SEMIA]QOG20841.1 hypothetical protein FOM02_29340 [Bradyrhizobium sp. SEMIA]